MVYGESSGFVVLINNLDADVYIGLVYSDNAAQYGKNLKAWDCYHPIKSALLTKDPLLELSSSIFSGFTSEQMQKLLSLITDNSSGSIHANMAGLWSCHVGNLKLSNNVILYDVLVDLKKETVLRTSSESGGPYLFDMNKDNTIGKFNMVMCYNVSKLLWRNRLGYLADQVLSVLHNDLKISKSSSVHICEVCHRAK
nr:ribonuclease H-like domain-containing protein [Tanacetum cinerariifolium]